ncbi:MAG: N-acetylmuramoyl-L-alanine amidase [Verrucomicrobiales bacterium]
MRNVAAALGLGLFVLGLAILISRDNWITWLVELELERAPFDVVILDAGHGGQDGGAKRDDRIEKDIVLDVTLRTAESLRRRGFHVHLTREDDTFIALPERVRQTNRFKRPVFVSIHANAAKNLEAHGIETFYTPSKPIKAANWRFANLEALADSPLHLPYDEMLAAALQVSMIQKTNAVDRGIKPRGLYVTRNTPHPAVLVELGFLTNAMEGKLLQQDSYRQTLADALTEGIEQYQQQVTQARREQDGDRVWTRARPVEPAKLAPEDDENLLIHDQEQLELDVEEASDGADT